jgi:hypothetical protein
MSSGAIPGAELAARDVDDARLARVAIAVASPVLAWIGWNAALGAFTPQHGFGYALGIVGGSAMAVLLLYPLPKRVRRLRNWLPMKYWFAMHMVCGIAGPLLVVFHSTFRLRSLNATVAMISMILVALSGVVGRFIYRRVHQGMDGAQAALKERREALARELERVEATGQRLPDLRLEIDRFAALATLQPSTWHAQVLRFVGLGFRRARAQRRIARALGRVQGAEPGSLESASRHTLLAMQRAAQFVAYERLLSLWRIVHVPLVFMLVISAVVHVVAVHAY